jgi:hypothetical protein
MSGSYSSTVEIGAKVRMTRSHKGRVSNALRVQPESRFLWVVLTSRKRTRDDFGLETVPPTGLIFIWIFLACRFATLSVRIMEDLLKVCDGLSLFDWGVSACCGWM